MTWEGQPRGHLGGRRAVLLGPDDADDVGGGREGEPGQLKDEDEQGNLRGGVEGLPGFLFPDVARNCG